MPLGEAVSPDPFAAVGEGVVKQRCGTCRFFDEEGGFVGSGWCRHPQRVTTGALLMVRRDELACRNGWDQSLWECDTGSALSGAVDAAPRNGHGPLLPVSPESVRALVVHPNVHEHEGEDVLLSEARIVSEPHERWEPPSRPPSAVGFDPRTALFRAREAHKERARAKAAAERRAAGAEAALVSAEASPLNQPAPEEALRDGFQPVPVNQYPMATRGWDSVPDEAEREAGLARFLESEPEFSSAMPGLDLEPAREQVSDSGEVCAPEPAPNSAPAVWARPDRIRPDLPPWFRTDLPRVCRSCRDFRPSADGQRGWCANAWAFTHSRLVQADEPTPCQSAIGDWWVPVDDVWLVAADVSIHGRATPMLDRALVAETTKRRRS